MEASTDVPKIPKIKRDANWLFVLFLLHVHVLGILGIYYVFVEAYIATILFTLIITLFAILGVTAGAHRLWTHHSYDGSKSLKIFLMICQTLSGQGSIYDWVVSHRMHHKHFGTDLDPFNASKGFLYAHIVCQTTSKSEQEKEFEKEIDTTDLENDSVVMFQKKYYYLLYFLICVLLPINAPCEYWGEGILSSFIIVGWLRHAIVLHTCWLINSATKVWGVAPGERYPCDTNMIFLVNKSYWTQYHYLAPWDYLTGEFGEYGTDCTTKFIRVCAALGLVTNLRTIGSDAVKAAVYRSVTEKKVLQECLLDAEKETPPEIEDFLKPLKYT